MEDLGKTRKGLLGRILDSSSLSDMQKIENNAIALNSRFLDSYDFTGTLLHEINHYIQLAEGFDRSSTGSSSKRVKNIDDYYNNLGEIMSNEANINRNLAQKQLDDIILPE